MITTTHELLVSLISEIRNALIPPSIRLPRSLTGPPDPADREGWPGGVAQGIEHGRAVKHAIEAIARVLDFTDDVALKLKQLEQSSSDLIALANAALAADRARQAYEAARDARNLDYNHERYAGGMVQHIDAATRALDVESDRRLAVWNNAQAKYEAALAKAAP